MTAVQVTRAHPPPAVAVSTNDTSYLATILEARRSLQELLAVYQHSHRQIQETKLRVRQNIQNTNALYRNMQSHAAGVQRWSRHNRTELFLPLQSVLEKVMIACRNEPQTYKSSHRRLIQAFEEKMRIVGRSSFGRDSKVILDCIGDLLMSLGGIAGLIRSSFNDLTSAQAETDLLRQTLYSTHTLLTLIRVSISVAAIYYVGPAVLRSAVASPEVLATGAIGGAADAAAGANVVRRATAAAIAFLNSTLDSAIKLAKDIYKHCANLITSERQQLDDLMSEVDQLTTTKDAFKAHAIDGQRTVHTMQDQFQRLIVDFQTSTSFDLDGLTQLHTFCTNIMAQLEQLSNSAENMQMMVI